MSLEDIVKAGKKDVQVEAVAQEFRKKPYDYENLFTKLSKIDGSEKLFQELGISLNDFKDLSSARVNDYVMDEVGMAQEELADRVHRNYVSSINWLGEENNGRRNISGLIAGVQPLIYDGLEPRIYAAHGKAYEAVKNTENPKESFGKLLRGKENSIAGRAVIFLAVQHPEIANLVIARLAERAIEKLYNSFENVENARDYAVGLYENMQDKDKKNFAYSIGRAITKINLEKKRAA
jgi:hypothetical protein